MRIELSAQESYAAYQNKHARKPQRVCLYFPVSVHETSEKVAQFRNTQQAACQKLVFGSEFNRNFPEQKSVVLFAHLTSEHAARIHLPDRRLLNGATWKTVCHPLLDAFLRVKILPGSEKTVGSLRIFATGPTFNIKASTIKTFRC